jgi:geranylgeranyl diphosphate synthase type II
VDDLLDVVGSTEDLGKSVGADQRKRKLTYPRLLGLDETRNRAQAAMTRALAALDEAGVSAPLLVDLAEYIVRRSR